jgi:hypothetical protein
MTEALEDNSFGRDQCEAIKDSQGFWSFASDGNKSLYLVFVGVVFLSILDCF